MNFLAKIAGAQYNLSYLTGRGSARLERTVRVREVRGSNPRAPTGQLPSRRLSFFVNRHIRPIMVL